MAAAEIAAAFGLSRAVRTSDGPVARGKQGEVWRLETSEGHWAVTVPFDVTTETEVTLATRFQETAYAAGVRTPRYVVPLRAVCSRT